MTWKKNTMMNTMNAALVDLPAPANITHMWNFGSLLGICLMIQIVSGIFLAMHYTSDVTTAFNCISHIMRDVSLGWFTRLAHANGASLFFLAMFIHIGRGLFFQSFLLTHTWLVGVMIFLVSMMTAFLGYVLPWGQMSYWGATVITNLLSAIPHIGQYLVEWVWGGFSVNSATLNRFFSLHYLMPLVISALVMVHLIFLHEQKSSNPLGIQKAMDKIPFHPYFSYKDLCSMSLFMFIFMMINTQMPFMLMDPENFTPANPLSTPVHIQPEWYFLFAYTILRSIPNKLGGVVALLMSVLILVPLAFSNKSQQFNKKKLITLGSFWLFVLVFVLLTWLGMKPVEAPYINMGKVLTAMYFSWFTMLIY